MGYKKGQAFGSEIGLVLLIFFLVLLFYLILSAIAFVVAVAIFIFGAIAAFKLRKPTAANEKLLPILGLIAGLLAGLFLLGTIFPEIVDAPARYEPNLCAIHYLMFYNISHDRVSDCHAKVAAAQQNPGACDGSYYCAKAAVSYGLRSCDGFHGYQDQTLRTCLLALGNTTKKPSVCLMPNLNQYYQLECFVDVLYWTNFTVSCDGIYNKTYSDFCEAAKSVPGSKCESVFKNSLYPVLDLPPCVAALKKMPELCEILAYPSGGEMAECKSNALR